MAEVLAMPKQSNQLDGIQRTCVNVVGAIRTGIESTIDNDPRIIDISHVQERISNGIHFLEKLSLGEIKDGRIALARGLINLSSRVIIGAGAIDASIEYFSGYKTFREIYKEEGRAKAYIWAVKNAVPAVMKGFLSVAAFPAYVFIKSASFTEQRLRTAFSTNDETAKYIAASGVITGLLTELLISRILPHEWVAYGYDNLIGSGSAQFLESLKRGVCTWGMRMAALQGESYYIQGAARLAGYDLEKAIEYRNTFYNSAMATLSAKVMVDRYGGSLKEFAELGLLSGIVLIKTPEAFAAPPLQDSLDGPIYIEGEIPELTPAELRIDLSKNESMKTELFLLLQRIGEKRVELHDVDTIEQTAIFDAIYRLENAVTQGLKDDTLTIEEYHNILETLNALPKDSITIPIKELVSPELITGTYRDTWTIDGQSVENITLNGSSWSLVNKMEAKWLEILGRDGSDINGKLKDMVTLGVNYWGEGYEEHFQHFKELGILQILESKPFDDGMESYEYLYSLLVQNALIEDYSFEDIPWERFVENMGDDEAAFIVFHTANGTQSILEPFISDMSERLVSDIGSETISEEEAKKLAEKFLYELSYKIVEIKHSEMDALTVVTQSVQVELGSLLESRILIDDSSEFISISGHQESLTEAHIHFALKAVHDNLAHDLQLDIDETERFLQSVGISPHSMVMLSRYEQYQTLGLIMASIQNLQDLQMEWGENWELREVERLLRESGNIHEYAAVLEREIPKFTVIAELSKSILERNDFFRLEEVQSMSKILDLGSIYKTGNIMIGSQSFTLTNSVKIENGEKSFKVFLVPEIQDMMDDRNEKSFKFDPYPLVMGVTIVLIGLLGGGLLARTRRK